MPLRDGVICRANVFRPERDDGPWPVILSAHPYGKDNLAKPTRGGRYRVPLQTHLIPQSVPYEISPWTSWEAPDPAFWVPRGYVVVNADLRGWGRSDGVGDLLSEQEALDYHDLVEWAGTQPWSNGKVGTCGVSYLAIAQWRMAATRPPHLAAICPWEGFTDVYRDFARPGGVREDGFMRLWSTMLKRQRRSAVDVREQQVARPLIDDWWRARDPDLSRIEVPMLVCGSFSDHNLHSAGSFHGFERSGSSQKWLYTHRGPKWSTFYGTEALEAQAEFFDHFLKGADTGITSTPPVRVEVREDADTIVEVRHADAWPLPGTQWRTLHLDAVTGGLGEPPPIDGSVSFGTRKGRARFVHRFDDEVDVIGPMALRLHLSIDRRGDVNVFAGVRKRRHGRVVGFEGSYGFRHALVTCGWLKASHRALDPELSTAWAPEHPHDREEPLRPGEIVALDIALLPSATRFRAGEELEVVVAGRWFFPRNPLTGQFPAWYERSTAATCRLFTGEQHDAHLVVPVVDGGARGTV